MGFEEATPKRKLPMAASSVSDSFSVEVGPYTIALGTERKVLTTLLWPENLKAKP
jgi:hypothetical protein